MDTECQLSDEERRLVDRHKISCEQRTVYLYAGYKYERLSDAINYAEIVASREAASDESSV